MLGPVTSQILPASFFPAAGEIAIVGDERPAVAAKRRFHHRMAAAFDFEGERILDDGTGPVFAHRELGERRRHVDAGDRVGERLERSCFREDLGREAIEDRKLQRQRSARGAGDAAFETAQFRRGKTHDAGERLAVNERLAERRRHQLFALRPRHLDEIAEHVVVLDLERANAGLLGVARLQARDHPARGVAQFARFIQILIVARAHEAAGAFRQRQLVGKRIFEFGGERGFDRGKSGGGLGKLRRGFRLRENLRELRRERETVADSGKIARAAAGKRQAGKRARKIGYFGQEPPQLIAERSVASEKSHRIEPRVDRLRIDERAREPPRESSRAPAEVRVRSMVESRLPSLSPASVRTSSRLVRVAASIEHDRARRLAARRREIGLPPDLRALDIGDRGGGGGKLQAR